MAHLRPHFRMFQCMTLTYTDLWYNGGGRFLDGSIFNADYLKRLVAGDEATERHFTTYFSDHLRIKLRSRLRSSQMIDDVKQETFLRVFRAIRGSNPPQQPERLPAYVNAFCNNILLERFRDQHKYQGSGHDAVELADESWDPDRELVNEARKKLIREMLDEMPEKERRLLQAMFLEDRDKDEICRDFGVDREYLRVLLHRAKNRARGIFVQKMGAT